jgi:hypothetical protein
MNDRVTAFYRSGENMDTSFPNQPKPTLVNVIAWMTLASGILNFFWGFAATLFLFWTIICIPFTVLPTILGIFEIIYAAKLLSNPPQAVQPSPTIAVLEILCVVAFNLFSAVVGILALVFYNDLAVQEYFARLNGTSVPAAPVTPIPVPEPALPLEKLSSPAPEETPEKPK